MNRYPSLLLLATTAAGCAAPGASTLHAYAPNQTYDEERCTDSARREVRDGKSDCGRFDPRDRSLGAREARLCALVRCMKAKGYSRYGLDASVREGW